MVIGGVSYWLAVAYLFLVLPPAFFILAALIVSCIRTKKTGPLDDVEWDRE